MNDLDILPWLEPLVTAPFVWREIGSAGGIRAITHLRDPKDQHEIVYLNLVTAIAATFGLAFHSGRYHAAAEAIGMPQELASALIRAGDNNLPVQHEMFVPLTRLVEFLAKGGNL